MPHATCTNPIRELELYARYLPQTRRALRMEQVLFGKHAAGIVYVHNGLVRVMLKAAARIAKSEMKYAS